MSDERLMQALASGSTFHRVLRTIPCPPPAVGVDFVFTVEGGRVWRPIALRAVLTTSAAVANRVVNLNITDGNNTFATLPNQGPQVASQVNAYTWADGYDLAGGSIAAVGSVATGLPDLAMPAGFTLRGSTLALDAGDQWSSLTLLVEEAAAQPQGVHEYRDAQREAFLIATSIAAEAFQ